MEGPYRDLGSGFARLTGVEGARRGPSRISHVEDALLELLRNARDAGAANIFVASALSRRRFRTLTVIDDGCGILETYAPLVFEPGVTTRHLDPVRDGHERAAPHGAGLALYHLKQAAVEAAVFSASSPTVIRATFDTRALPERSLQSGARRSRSNLLATAEVFVANASPHAAPNVFYGPEARVLATLLRDRIIQTNGGARGLTQSAGRLGFGLSQRTVQRILRREVPPLAAVSPEKAGPDAGLDAGSAIGRGAPEAGRGGGGPVLKLGADERARIAAILSRAAGAEYLEVEDLKVESRPGEVSLTVRVYEPEEEYE